jgi:hypothetical protein
MLPNFTTRGVARYRTRHFYLTLREVDSLLACYYVHYTPAV